MNKLIGIGRQLRGARHRQLLARSFTPCLSRGNGNPCGTVARYCTGAEAQAKGSGSLKTVVTLSGIAGLGLAAYSLNQDPNGTSGTGPNGEVIWNWSGTHKCNPKKLHEPETLEELERIVADAHEQGKRLRPAGNALSPNGIALSNEEMVSLRMMDKIVDIDSKRKQVTVEAGISVGELCRELRSHGLTLQNLASIAEQQVGGFLQVGAHGTGSSIPPVDQQVVRMKVVTPGRGTIEVSEQCNSEIFQLAKCGLGMFGVVSEVTLQCVDAHKLVEHTFTLSFDELLKQHHKLVRKHKHTRYHWLPYTDWVVVTTCDPLTWWDTIRGRSKKNVKNSEVSDAEKLEPLRNLLVESGRKGPREIEDLSFADLRTLLLEDNALDVEYVKEVNKAEAEFWKRSEGYRVGFSDEILQFDCGGQQWVLEMAFPVGPISRPSQQDIHVMRKLLKEIEANSIPAPAPIEQRWSSSSNSVLSPASSLDPSDVYSWVGIILYLPLENPALREDVTRLFKKYASLMRNVLTDHKGQEHWAKIELPDSKAEREAMIQRVRSRYPVDEIRQARATLDPKNILGSELLDALFGN